MSKSLLRIVVIAAALFAAIPSVLFATNVDLSIPSVSGTPNPITLNTGNITYTVQVFNASGTSGTNTVLTNTLPVSSTYVSSSATGGGICNQSAGVVTCNWTSIPASNNFFVTIVVTPTAGGSLTLSSSVSGTETDPNSANNNASGSVTVNDQIDLRIIGVTGSPNPMTLGTGNATYSVQVFNGSTSQGTGTVLTATLPASSTYVSATATGSGICNQSAGTVTCNWTSIPASNNFFATIVVTPTVGGTATLAANVAGTEPDPNTANNSVGGSVTVNSQIDLRIIGITGSPNPMTLGTGNISYSVQVFNGSTSQGTGTVLTATLPASSTYVSATATGSGICNQSAGTVTCNWTSIPASNNFFATIVVTPTVGGTATLAANVAGTEPDPNTADNNVNGSVTVNSQIDLRIIGVTGSPNPMTLGTGNATYSVQVFNASTSQGTGTVLTATLPASSTYVSATATGSGICNQSAGTVTCNWTSIPASNNFFATIVVTPTVGGTATLAASVAGTEPDPNTADNSVSGSVTVNSQIDLRIIGVTGSPNPMTLGTANATYSVQVFNASTSQGTGTVLTATLPASSTYVSATATGSGICSQSAGTVTCNWTSIPASNNFFATIVVTPTVGGTATLAASVSGLQPDPNTADNNVNGSVTVNSQIDLQVFGVSGTPDPITFAGGNVTYSIQVFNASTSQGTNPVLTSTLPSNSNYVSSSATSSGICNHSGGTVTCNWTSIPASNNYFVTIVVTPTIPGNLTLSTNVSGTQPDPNTANNAGSKTTTVTPTACYALPSGAVAWYRAEGNGVDAAGPNNLTPNGGVSYTTGKVNQGFSFDGTSGEMVALDNPTLQQTTLTIEGWFFLTGGTGTRTLVSKAVGTALEDSFVVYIAADGSIAAGTGNDTVTEILTTSTVPTTNAWHHFAYIFDGSIQQLYLDGVTIASAVTTQTILYDSNPLVLGADIDNGSPASFFPGRIDELTFYNRALTMTEVQSIFGAGTFGKCYIPPAAPTIIGFTPTSDYGGASVVITGTDFFGVSAVKFNGVSATFTGDSTSQITAFVPAGATTGTISVTTGGGTATSAGTFTVLTTAHWINSSGGNWSTASNWSTGSVPGATTDAIIDANGTYTVNLDINASVLSLSVGGSVSGTQTLNLGSSRDLTLANASTVGSLGALALSSGRLLGAGVLSIFGIMNWNGDSEIQSAVTVTFGAINISGNGTRLLNGGTLNNNGVINWSGGNNISVYNSGVINNLATGLFSVTNDQLIYQHCCSAGQPFNNEGTFRKTVATGSTIVQTNAFNNTGTVDIQSGTFDPAGGGTSTSDFQASGGGSFLFENGVYTLGAGATLTGNGTFQVSAGQLDVSAANVTVDHLKLTGGNLNIHGGASVATSATGIVDWIGDATLSGAGPLTIASGGTLNLTGSGTRYIDGGTLNNNGTVNWTGANNISIYDSGVINNQAGGLFSVKNDQLIYQHCCTAGLAFNNVGTFRKSVATGTTTIQNNGFNNTGTVDIQSGTFNPSAGGTSSAIFNAPSNGTFLFTNNTYTLASGATLAGSGNFQVSSGQLAVNANGVTVDHLTLTGGTLNVAGALSTTPSGVVDWTADSTLTGTGTLTIGSGGTMNINGNGTRSIDGGTINNSGTVNWSGGNNISVYDSGVINNQSGGLFSVKNDQLIYQHCCSSGQAFNNAGTFRKTVATGTTTIQSNGFNNSGTVDVQSGIFNPSSGGTSTSVFNAISTGIFRFNNGSYTLGSGATLTGNGTFQVDSTGQLLVNATGVTVDHLNLAGGTLNVPGSISTSAAGVIDWGSDATLTGAGSLTIGNGGTLNLPGSGTRVIDGGTLNNSGIVNWSGTNNLSIVNSGVINNLAGGLFSVTNDQLIYVHCCSAGQPFNNAGTFRKTTAIGTTSFNGIGFANSGTIEADSGTIAFNSSHSSSGSPVYQFGIGSTSTFGRLTFANFISLTGALIAAPVNGFVPQGGQQYQIISFPSGSATFAPKTLTYGSSPVRSFADSYSPTGVTLTASGPAITMLTPNQGDLAGGTAVTITGSGFVSGGSLGVTFGGNAATSVAVVNSSTITCITPAHSSGLADVVLTNGDGEPTTLVNGFTYGNFSADVGITSGASPASVANGGAFTLTTVVTNNGPISASNITVTIPLPPNITLAGVPSSTQGSCGGTTTVTCGLGTLAIGDSATQTINLTATSTGTATLNASVTATQPDPVSANNSSITNVVITGPTIVVTTNADSGPGSLRQAILDANNALVCTAPCTIAFNLPGGQLTISPPASLPAITAANVTIDATTQPGFSGAPLITLDGSGNPNPSAGLQLSGGHDSVKGLSIVSFQGAAIVIDTAGNDVIAGNYLGMHVNGSTTGQNAGDGIHASTGSNTIGGTTASARNVISGNFLSGVVLTSAAATGNLVQGNYIGLNAAGNAAAANHQDGIQLLSGASNNTIGGLTPSERNVIAGNQASGFYVNGSVGNLCTGNVIEGNYIGTDATGSSTIGNSVGVFLAQFASNNTVGGISAAAANTIDFTTGGVVLLGSGNGNVILQNAIRDTVGLPIDLEMNGQTPNDAGDSDVGANGLQNFPLFLDASLAGSTLTTHFNVDSAAVPSTNSLRVELFRSDPSHVQLLKWIGSQCFAGNSLNGVTISVVGTPLVIGDNLVGTATSYSDGTCNTPNDGTSEVSNGIAVAACAPPSPTITPGGPTTFCSGGSVTLTASASASYQWRNFGTPIIGANAQQLVVTTAGSYTVTVTNAAGCSGTSAATSVTVNSTVNVTITGTTAFCAGGNTTLTANPSGGSGSFTGYQWLLNGSPIGGATASTYVATAAGSYTVSATDSTGCTGTSSPTSVTVNPIPSASINAPASACANSAVTASIVSPVAGATYTWSVTNGALQSGQGTSSITFTVTTATPVTLNVTASANSCTANGSASITVGAFVPTITSGATSFCPGGSVTLTSSSGTSYQWLLNGSPIGGANAQSYVASVAGNYSVTVATGAGCNGTSAATAITQSAASTPTITPSGPTTFCSGGSVTLTSSAAASYQWLLNGSPIGGATNASFVAAASGAYSVTITNAAGCSDTSSSVNVTAVPPVSVLAPATVAPGSAGNTASVTPGPAGSTYVWTISGGTITSGNGTPSIAWTAGASGNAVISITRTSGSCTASSSATVAIANLASADLSITVTAAPNPVTAGDTITFTVNVTNSGADTSQDVRVLNTLSGVTAPVASGNGWTCITNGLTIGCNLISLTVGPAAPLTITATAAAGKSASDNASVIATTSDPNGNNNSAAASVTVNAQPSCNNNAPSAIAPAAGASNVANPVNFSWSAAPNATAYDLWIASSGAAPALVTTTQSTSAMINLPAGTSTWYVTAHFASNCPTLSSTPRDLTVAASANCNQPAPQLIAPSPNAIVNSPVTFSWTPVAQAVGYRLWIALDGGGLQDAGTANGATSLAVSLTGSSVSWHVDAIFPGCNPTSSASSSFTIASTDPCAGHAAPALLTPTPNATLSSSVIDFHWTAVAGATGYRLWTSINGAAFAPMGTTASATSMHVTLTSGLVAWFVEALFSGCASVPSPPQSFTIPPATDCNNPAATPQSPPNDATLTDGTVDFAWAPAANAIGYELWLAFNNGAPSIAGTTTTTTLRRTIGPGNIEWFVRAQFNGCDPIESTHAHFTYTPPADCSLLRPILTAPADAAKAVISPFDLRWSNVPGATQYKVWLGSGDAPPVAIGTAPSTHLDNQSAPEGPVTWFVEALFASCPSLRSTSSTFTAAHSLAPCAPPDVPLPRAESTASSNVEYMIRWTPSGPTGTTQYELQESDNASFTSPLSTTTSASELPFKHANGGDAPVTFYYRVRAVSTCTGTRTLFSLPLAVQVLPSNVTDPASANGSTPADNPQTTHYQIHIGGGENGSAHKGVIAAAAGDTFSVSTNQPWLSVSPLSGTVAPEGTTLTVTANTDGLPVGTSSGAVNISFGSATNSSHGSIRSLDTKPTSSTTVSVNLVQPVSPTAKTAPPPDALIIPAVAHADGINSKFQSDIRVTNSSAQPMKYQVTFQPTGDSGIANGKQTTVDIDPGHTIALDDVLESWFGSNGATGTLEVRPLNTPATTTNAAAPSGLANILTFAASRTYNTTANGTFGQYIPAIPFAAFVGRAADITKSTILSLQQIAQSPAYRTNFGLVEGSGDPASVLVSVFGDNGQKLTEFTQDLKGGQHIQLNSILAQKNVQVSDGRIEVKVVSPGGKVTAYASVLDNLTNDPLLVLPVAVNQTAAPRYVLPGVADLSNGVANWQTDVRLFNPSTNIVKATLTYFSQTGTSQSKDVSLAPGQVQTFDAALRQLFGITNDGGALHITTTATTPLVATARTYNQTANGTYGQFIPAVTANDAAALGSRPLQLLQIEESDRYRTNVGFAEVTGKSARIEVTAVPSDSKVATSTQIDIAPNQFVQYPQLLKSMGLPNMYNARVTVKVISGQGRVTAYASIIDMQTNDPTFVPAQ